MHKKLLKFKLASDDSDPDFSLFNLKALRQKRVQYGLKRRRSEVGPCALAGCLAGRAAGNAAAAAVAATQYCSGLADCVAQLWLGKRA